MKSLPSSLFRLAAWFAVLCLSTETASAALTVNVDLPITLTGLSNTVFTVKSGSVASLLEVGTTYFTVQVNVGSTVTVTGPANYRLDNSQGYDETCASTTRVLTLHAVSDAISTVISPVLTTVPCLQTQQSAGGSGGVVTSGDSAGGSGSTSSSAPTTSPTNTTSPTAPGPAGAGDAPPPTLPKTDKPVKKNLVGGFNDISDLPLRDITRILGVVSAMEKNRTFVRPTAEAFSPQTITTAGFASQILTTVDGKGCGSKTEYPGVAACLKAAQDRGYLPDTLTVRSRVSRFLYYKALLKALDISYENQSVTAVGFNKLCTDYAGSSDSVAQIYTAAKNAKLTGTYFMRKCQLDLNFSRLEAIRFADRALNR